MFGDKSVMKRPLIKRVRRKDKIKIHLKQVAYDDVGQIYVTQHGAYIE
jgi:hypothetical protein